MIHFIHLGPEPNARSGMQVPQPIKVSRRPSPHSDFSWTSGGITATLSLVASSLTRPARRSVTGRRPPST